MSIGWGPPGFLTVTYFASDGGESESAFSFNVLKDLGETFEVLDVGFFLLECFLGLDLTFVGGFAAGTIWTVIVDCVGVSNCWIS